FTLSTLAMHNSFRILANALPFAQHACHAQPISQPCKRIAISLSTFSQPPPYFPHAKGTEPFRSVPFCAYEALYLLALS
ncbi:MAG: hypothetical protein ACXVPC_07785, partial [Tumebacillaceae bacterium]